jgi:hypothetical protein
MTAYARHPAVRITLSFIVAPEDKDYVEGELLEALDNIESDCSLFGEESITFQDVTVEVEPEVEL